MAETGGSLIESILQLPGEFASIASQSPEQAILLAVGAFLTLGAAAVFGALAAGGLVEGLARAFPSASPPPEQRR